MKMKNVVLPAGSVTPDTLVYVSLSGGGEGPKRIKVDEALTLGTLGIDPASANGGSHTVEFPSDAMAEIAKSNLSPAQKKAKTDELYAKYEKAASAKASANMTIQDQVQFAVTKWLCTHKGFSTKDAGSNTPVIKEDELQVTFIPNGAAPFFSVTGTTVWG